MRGASEDAGLQTGLTASTTAFGVALFLLLPGGFGRVAGAGRCTAARRRRSF